ncbi:MAG TPA: protein kinase [Terriglobales bacterium]|nr:protein kinase [Terriglobales bacterium]
MGKEPGSRLGPYEIISPLGAGGMGEVYKARDTRLEREVAIKILAAHLVTSPDIRQRFEREARAISSLNHPNICTLHDVGHHEGTDFLVMEFLEGETLADRLKKGPMPIRDVLRHGIEIADALDKAHRQGIVHRDLKPGNVMLTKAGAKLLDFGLAKPAAMGAAVGSQTAPVFSAAMTISNAKSPLTAAGTIVGTMQYMSPEQIEGLETDARSDIFAFGALLYEMATGKRAFEGKSQLSVASAILEKDPELLSVLQPLAPPALEHVILRALAKDPNDRWQSASDVKAELKWVMEGGSRVGTPAIIGKHRKHREWVAWGLAAVGLLIAMAVTLPSLLRPAQPATPIRTIIMPPEELRFGLDSVAISPDGTKVVFVGISADQRRALWVRPLGSLSAQQLAGTGTAIYPFWSPDSRQIGFFADSKLKKIDAAGGPVITLADAQQGRGGAWGKDGTIIFSPTANSGLWQVKESGGVASEITKLKETESSHRFPAFLEDGEKFLFYATSKSLGGSILSTQSDDKVSGVYTGSLSGGDHRFLIASDSQATYSSGYLLYIFQTNLLAQPFHPGNAVLRGAAVPVAEKVRMTENRQKGAFSTSREGMLIFASGEGFTNSELTWMDREGKTLSKLGEPSDFQYPRISPDGKQVAVVLRTESSQKQDVWVYEMARGIRTRLTFTKDFTSIPVWMPDGKSIIFNDSGLKIKRKSISGLGQEEVLLEAKAGVFPNTISPDGKVLTYMNFEGGKGPRLWVHEMNDKKQKVLLNTNFIEVTAAFSHDGKWLAFSGEESGRPEIYVVPFPALDGKFQVSTSGGNQPTWGSGDKEIFYLAPDGKMMSSKVQTGSTFIAETAKPLFDTRVRQIRGSFMQYDIFPDGKKFLINTRIEDAKIIPLTVVQNWTSEIRKQ